MFAITRGASLEAVSFHFCDDIDGKVRLSNLKVIAVNPGEENEVCVVFSNGSKEKTKVTYGLSYGLLNKWWTQVCDQDSSWDNKFSKFFEKPGDGTLTLDPGEEKTVKIKIKVPLWINGMQYWCLINTVEGSSPEKTAWSIFSVVVRKIFPLNLFIGKAESIKSSVILSEIGWWVFSTNSKIKAEMKDGTNLEISAKVKNGGNISQTVQITGSIHNFLGFEKMFTTTAVKLSPGEEKELVANVGVIPWYKGVFNVNMNVKNTPFFDFEISGIDEAIKNWATLSESGTIYAFSRVSIVILVVIIGVIILIIRPKKKNIEKTQ